jgi:hypothetical protein
MLLEVVGEPKEKEMCYKILATKRQEDRKSGSKRLCSQRVIENGVTVTVTVVVMVMVNHGDDGDGGVTTQQR